MIETLVSMLKSGLELAFLLAVLAAYLKRTQQTGLLPPLRWGALLALAASPVLTYSAKFPLKREVIEGDISLLAAVSSLGLILWIGSSWNTDRDGATKGVGETSRGSWALIFGASLVLAAPRFLEIALVPTRVFTPATGLLSTDQAVRASAILAGLALAALVGMTLHKVVAEVSLKWVTSITILSLLITLVQEATTAVQVMLLQRVLPLTDWLFRIIVPLVNNSAAFYYSLFAAACVLVLLAAWERRGREGSFEGLNPAQKRKIRARSRRVGALIGMVGVLLVLVILVDGASAVYANNPPSLSPATPVARQGDVVMMPADSVIDGTLHRFSYETADGTVVRFLVIHKGSGVFGVALDACEFCGAAGYRQDGKNVICSRCGAAINIATIGFPGGCNPIPLSYSKQGDSLTVPVDALQAARGTFGR